MQATALFRAVTQLTLKIQSDSDIESQINLINEVTRAPARELTDFERDTLAEVKEMMLRELGVRVAQDLTH